MLTKYIDGASFFDPGEVTVTLIDLDDTNGLVKTATDNRIVEFAQKIKPESGKIYVHILAMGAGEFFGANRNADYFPEQNLIEHHETFETSPAHIFRNHVNKDPSIAIGTVIFTVYNHRMHRVEVVAEIDVTKAPDIKERIDRGEWPATSMACRTPYDVCSICGNKAHTRAEYCVHIRNDLGKIYPDGRKVMALNVAPLSFFDMSIVFRPADVTSSILQKVANEYQVVENSADAAEALGLTDITLGSRTKAASLKKFSELIKKIDDGIVANVDSNMRSILSKVKDVDMSIVPRLRDYDLKDVFTTMAHMGLVPSVSFLAELIAQNTWGIKGAGLGAIVRDALDEVSITDVPTYDGDFGGEGEFQPYVAHALLPFIPGSSIAPEYVEKRAFNLRAIPGTNDGFVQTGSGIEPTAAQRYAESMYQHPLMTGQPKQSMLKTLLTLGGVALAAKWYISQMIEKSVDKRIRESNTMFSHQNHDSGVKIMLVKSASDYNLLSKIALASVVNEVPGRKLSGKASIK